MFSFFANEEVREATQLLTDEWEHSSEMQHVSLMTCS